jgi:hypothetical protein
VSLYDCGHSSQPPRTLEERISAKVIFVRASPQIPPIKPAGKPLDIG